MSTQKLVGEGYGRHSHSYEDTVSGHWQWCKECECMVTTLCDHRERVCHERSLYIRLKVKYETHEMPN